MPENNPTDNPLIDRRFQNAYLNLVSQIINKNITLTLQEKNAFLDLFDNKKLNAFTRYEKLRNEYNKRGTVPKHLLGDSYDKLYQDIHREAAAVHQSSFSHSDLREWVDDVFIVLLKKFTPPGPGMKQEDTPGVHFVKRKQGSKVDSQKLNIQEIYRKNGSDAFAVFKKLIKTEIPFH